MKNIFRNFRNRFILVAALLSIVQLFAVYIYNFQSELPVLKYLETVYSCFSIYVVAVIPFLFTRNAFKAKINDIPSGWKIGLTINALLIGFFFIFTILDYVIKTIIQGFSAVVDNLLFTLAVNLIGSFLILIIGLFAGWLAEKITVKANQKK